MNIVLVASYKVMDLSEFGPVAAHNVHQIIHDIRAIFPQRLSGTNWLGTLQNVINKPHSVDATKINLENILNGQKTLSDLTIEEIGSIAFRYFEAVATASEDGFAFFATNINLLTDEEMLECMHCLCPCT